MGFFRRRAAGYRAAIRVERYRAHAVQLREDDPESYAQMLAQADGSEAEESARRDPDAYVALILAGLDDYMSADPEVQAGSPFSDVKLNVDDVLVRDTPQPYIDLAEVLDRDQFDHLYAGVLRVWDESSGNEPPALFRENPSWVVGKFLQSRLEEMGYTLDDVNRLVAASRTSGESVSFDLANLEGTDRDIDYWPEIDLDDAWARISEFWAGVYKEAEEAGEAEGLRYFPGWLVRRQVAVVVWDMAMDARPDLEDDLTTSMQSVGLSEKTMFDEDAEIDERLDAFLEAYHLGQFVDALVQALNAESGS